MRDTINNNTGRYGAFGGCYVPESLIAPLKALKTAFFAMSAQTDFRDELNTILKNYAGRPTPLTPATRLQAAIDGPRLFLKREDLLHTGAHKLNNALGQCLLAKRLKKKRIIAETGAGQHGVATATACAYFDLSCDIYMGAQDIKRQALNVAKMQLLGATVIAVDAGEQTLKEAVNAALRDYAENYEHTHYCLGSSLGPDPYPTMVAYFQQIIGLEAKQQLLAQTGQAPTTVVACVGGGSNAIGIFSAFLEDSAVHLVGVEGGGIGDQLGQHAARFRAGKTGVLHGTYTYVLQNAAGQISPTRSISAGLDYPAVAPQHAALFASGRATYTSASDNEAKAALYLLAKTEGIIPALESAHAVAYVIKTSRAKQFKKDAVVLINISGRGDKDLPQLMDERNGSSD